MGVQLTMACVSSLPSMPSIQEAPVFTEDFAYYILAFMPETRAAVRSYYETEERAKENDNKIRIRNLPIYREEKFPELIADLILIALDICIKPQMIVSCERVRGWFNGVDDIVVTFNTRSLRDEVLLEAEKRMDVVRRLLLANVEITEELAEERAAILTHASEKFGPDRVDIYSGGIHIRFPGDNAYRILTLPQYRMFLDCITVPKLVIITDETDDTEV